MIPDGAWSSTPQDAEYYAAAQLYPFDSLTSVDLGPVALTDVTEGLMAYSWQAYYEGGTVYVKRLPDGSPTALFSRDNINHLSMTFDQQGRITIAFVDNGGVYLYWYDSLAEDWVITKFDDGTRCFISLDLRQRELSSMSDMLLVYQSENSAYLRQQRDRFSVRYTTPLIDVPGLNLMGWAMAKNQRMKLAYQSDACSDM